ncbi:MAG TPA: histidine phosphatase family protein [Candidatus Binataceae bacterium]|nr:histidine phosphatase family protein [Candidatus Binataceae bacterium]
MTAKGERGLFLALVRHGETDGRSSIRYFGRTDVALSDEGRAQMRACGRWLRNRFGRLAPVFSSPLRRASEGARIIAGTAAALIEIAEFVEVDFGLFEGLTADEIRERHPEEFRRWDRGRLAPDYAYPRGESRAAFAARVNRGSGRMLAEITTDDAHSGPNPDARCALLVAHRGVIRAIARMLMGIEPVIELGSIQLLAREGAQWRAEAVDFTGHLGGPE